MFKSVTIEEQRKWQEQIDSYRFMCWVNGVVENSRVIRDLLRKKRGYYEEGEDDEM